MRTLAWRAESAGELAIDETFVGDTFTTIFNKPGIPPNGDPRSPDFIVQPNVGHTYSGSTKSSPSTVVSRSTIPT